MNKTKFAGKFIGNEGINLQHKKLIAIIEQKVQ